MNVESLIEKAEYSREEKKSALLRLLFEEEGWNVVLETLREELNLARRLVLNPQPEDSADTIALSARHYQSLAKAIRTLFRRAHGSEYDESRHLPEWLRN